MIRILYTSLLCILIFGCSANTKVRKYHLSLNEFRQTYKNDFLTNARSPLKEDDLQYLDFFKANADWKLLCTCNLITQAQPFEMPTYSGVTRTYIKFATADCHYNNLDFRIQLYKNIHQLVNPLYKNHIFLPFKDFSNGDTTYGGGRYINLMEGDIKDGNIEIDFNKCYNPWCAYSDGYNCPIPPLENHLNFSVNAGEKMYKGAHKKNGF